MTTIETLIKPQFLIQVHLFFINLMNPLCPHFSIYILFRFFPFFCQLNKKKLWRHNQQCSHCFWLACNRTTHFSSRNQSKNVMLFLLIHAFVCCSLCQARVKYDQPDPLTRQYILGCTILSCLNAGHGKRGDFQQCCGWVKEDMAFNNPQKWRPVDIVYCKIPAQLEALMQSEEISNFKWR